MQLFFYTPCLALDLLRLEADELQQYQVRKRLLGEIVGGQLPTRNTCQRRVRRVQA